ncbi:hypothetical protein [Streptomyces sp. NRRL S-378]|uniref:hypothetical protein n=1 Tax=Streptomyces sp. NRRL S-378 TaxID=1463904 RepID=UPI0004CC43CD
MVTGRNEPALEDYRDGPGCAAVRPQEADDHGDVLRVTDLVEKAGPGTAPSNPAAVGRHVLAPEVFGVLRRTTPGEAGRTD